MVGPIATTAQPPARGRVRDRSSTRAPEASAQRRAVASPGGAPTPVVAVEEEASQANSDIVMGPTVPATAGGEARRRLYCPVAGCPEGNCARSQGWRDPTSLRRHMEGHAEGRWAGDVPRAWMDQERLTQCTVCSRLLACRYGGACPRCRFSLGAEAADAPRDPRALPAGWPTFEKVFTEGHKVRAKVSAGAEGGVVGVLDARRQPRLVPQR